MHYGNTRKEREKETEKLFLKNKIKGQNVPSFEEIHESTNTTNSMNFN